MRTMAANHDNLFSLIRTSSAGTTMMAKAEARHTGLRIEIARSYDDLVALEADWVRLEQQTPAFSVFQSHAHLLIWARNFLADDKGRLCILLAYQDDALSLILPLHIFKRFGTTIAEVAGSPIAQYSEALTNGAALDAPLFAALIAALRAEEVDELNLENVREDGVLYQLAQACGIAAHNPRVAPFIELDQFADHDSFVRARSKGFGKKMRARRRQLEMEGEVRMEVIKGGPAARKAMADAVDLKREWLIQRGAMSTAFLDPISGACLLDLADQAPGAMVLIMLLNGATAAIRLGFVHSGTFFSYLSAYDQRLSNYSPGKLLMDFTLSDLRDRGVGKVDLLPPFSENKAGWTDINKPVADYLLPLSWRGRVHANFYQQRLRPIMRWSYYMLPDGLRRAVARKLIAD